MANYLFVGGDFALKSSFRIEDPPGSGLYDFLEPGDPLPDGDDTVDAGSNSGFGTITVDKWIGGSLTAGSITANIAEGVTVSGGTLSAPEINGVTASGTGVVNATTKMTNDPDEPVGSLIQASGGSITAPEIVNVLSLGGSSNLINMSGGSITATDVYSTGTSGMANSVSGGQLTVADYDIKSVADRTSTLNISNGGIVAITNDIAIGRRTGDETYITITGAGSDLDIGTKTLVIGEYGYGRLTIGKDADVSFAEVRTAIVDISSGPVRGGDIVVIDGGNLTVDGNATIGESDDGRLDISNGGTVEIGSDLLTGKLSNSRGSVKVTGANSELHVKGNFTFGDEGHQRLATLGDSGALSGGSITVDKDFTMASKANALGTLLYLVDGAGSTFSVKGSALLGDAGEASLTVANGAELDIAKDAELGKQLSGSGTLFVQSGGKAKFGGNVTLGRDGGGGISVITNATASILGALTLGSAGSESMDDCGNWSYGGTGSGQVLVSTGGSLTVGSTLTLANNDISFAPITVQSTGHLTVGAGATAGEGELRVNAGATLVGHGKVVTQQLTNQGTVEAHKGDLTIQSTGIAGSGNYVIGDTATLHLTGLLSDALGQQTFTFATRTSTSLVTDSELILDQPGAFAGTISNFALGDTLRLGLEGLAQWTGFTSPVFAHSEISGNNLLLTFVEDNSSKSITKSISLDGDLTGMVATFRYVDDNKHLSILDDAALSLSVASSQIRTHVDGTPTDGWSPYVDALVNGWGAWDETAGPITYWFGAQDDVHDAISVHGETYVLNCDSVVYEWSDVYKDAFKAALDVFSSATKLTFAPAASVEQANLVWWLKYIDDGTLGESENPAQVPNGHLWQYFDSTQWTEDSLKFGGDGRGTIIHEIGHALGLAHTHDGGYEADWNLFPGVPLGADQNTGLNGQNQTIFSAMSYKRGWDEVGWVSLTEGGQGGLGAFDIAALQYLYDVNDTYNDGSNTYILPDVNQPGIGWKSIWDAGGDDDTISNAGSSLGSWIDLREAPLIGPDAGGYVSSVNGIRGGYTIANGVFIENATGGSGIDTLIGNEFDNDLDGGAGNDQMYGGLGDDIYIVDDLGDKAIEAKDAGFDGVVTKLTTYTLPVNVEALTVFSTSPFSMKGNALANLIIGSAVGGVIDGSGGNDTIKGGAGNDVLKGGAGVDTVSYEDATGPVNASLALTSAQDLSAAGLGFDTLFTFESIVGSGFADTLTGSAAANIIDGGMGADIMAGGRGNDTYVVDDAGDQVIELASEGTDTVIIRQGGPTSFDLSAGTPWTNIEHVHYLGSDDVTGTGSSLANVLSGGSGADVLAGGGGNDRLIASQGAADGKSDQLIGGAGNDTFIVYEAIDVAEEASAADGVDTVESYATSYTLGVFIENLTILGGVAGGSRAGTGNGLANIIKGNISNDVLDGAADFDPLFADQLIGGLGNDTYIVRDAKDKVVEGTSAGIDTVVAHVTIAALAANVENIFLEASAGNINAKGNTLANLIVGNAGDNILDGSGGIDTVSYENAGSAVAADLTLKTATGGGGKDTLLGFENIIGSDHADTLIGTAAANRIDGGLGADTMSGGAGNDTYIVDDLGDVITETATGGTGDAVESAFDVDLTTLAGGFIEHATLTGAAFKAIGNAASNVLTGNAVANQLTGGAGRDFFVFKDALGPANIDTIVDFSVLDDTMRLDNAVFTAFTRAGAMAASAFTIGTAATDIADRVIYDKTTGALFYDEDGSGSALQIQFAVLDAGLMLTSKDFLIV